LPGMASLSELILDSNDIGDRGAGALARVLPNTASLTRLSLRNNPIGDEAGRLLTGLVRRIQVRL
ncbi:hypothetical protein EBZ80_24565, partial [bacterium]|nr:hypothetical protein [bacterium]